MAAENPDKLRELIEMWWQQAEQFKVLPLNNQPAKFGDTRYRHDTYVYYPGIGSIPENIAPNLRNRGFHIIAELDVTADANIDGALVCHGGPSGGYAVYIQNRRLHYVNNRLGAEITTISASVPLPAGRISARVVFTPTGRFTGDIALYYDDVPVGEGRIPRTTPFSYGVDGFTVGHQRGASVTPAYTPPFAVDHSVLRRVVIEGIGRAYRDPVAEERVAMGQQ
ncbi:unannotated protein [freshwater metagenome]|uniref:Unannotated protein n=1 Tax=freshwater metagenome TaxID=449393 RepID=A0A6J6PP04_9ZZZZ